MNNKLVINQQYLLRIFSKVNKLNNVPTQNRPVFIIKYGPPASGKSSQPMINVIKSFGYELNTYIHVNVDDVVESIKTFQNESMKMFQKRLTTNKLKDQNQIIKILNNVSNNNAKMLFTPYVSIRYNSRLNIENRIDELMKHAIMARKNISFETTGSTSFPFWIFNVLQPGINKYQIKILFPLVDCSEGWRRYKARAVKSYVQNKSVRFGLSRRQYTEQYIKSYKNFLKGKIGMNSGRHGLVARNAKYFVVSRKGKIMKYMSEYMPIINKLSNEAKVWAGKRT